MTKLKVFRTPIGFHDAYVAASSRKAALKAWGTSANLFARGAAEQVADEELMREPLAHPGKVIRVARGTMEDYLRAAPNETFAKSVDQTATTSPSARRHKSKIEPKIAVSEPKKKRRPRPSRSTLDKAETQLKHADAAHRAALGKLRAREQELEDERRMLEEIHQSQLQRLERAKEKAKAEYNARIERWAIESS
jgi:hypothetical protein